MILAMALSLCFPILLLEEPITDATLGIDNLDLHIELVCCPGNGVEHSQHAYVSNNFIKYTLYTVASIIGSCGYLSSPSYGRVSVTTLGIRERATYTCNSGFSLVGSSTRTCLSEGSWSGSQPICNCMLNVLTSLMILLIVTLTYRHGVVSRA